MITQLQTAGTIVRCVFTRKGERWEVIAKGKKTHDVRLAGGQLRLKGRLQEVGRFYGPEKTLSHIDYRLCDTMESSTTP